MSEPVRIKLDMGSAQRDLAHLMGRQLKWTDEPPSVPGWYWLREKPAFLTIVYWHSSDQSVSWSGGCIESWPAEGFEEADMEWLGPIPEPSEVDHE